jgi:hypothetical protein
VPVRISEVSRSKTAVCLVFSIILLAGLSEPASAELRVLGAWGIDVGVGAEFPDDHVFDVPDNGRLWLGQLFDKTSYLMLGPYKGTLENYRAECRGEGIPPGLAALLSYRYPARI